METESTIWLMDEESGECFRRPTAAEDAACRAAKDGTIKVEHPRRGMIRACLAERWTDDAGNDLATPL